MCIIKGKKQEKNRELMNVLSYKDWRYFDAVIEKAKIACKNSELTDIANRR